MSRYVCFFLTACFLAGMVGTSRAATLTFDVAPSATNPILTSWWNGIMSSGGNYTTSFVPPMVDPFDVTGLPTTLSLGFVVQTAINTSGPFEAFDYASGMPPTATSALVNFTIQAGSLTVPHNILVAGTIQGDMLTTASVTKVSFTGIRDATTDTNYPFLLGTVEPLTGHPAVLANLTLGVSPYALYIERNIQLSAPSNPTGDGIKGFLLPGNDVSPLLKIYCPTLASNPVAKTCYGTLILTNARATPIAGPFKLLLVDLPQSVSLQGASGSFLGWPYKTVAITSLAPGTSVSVPLKFSNPDQVKVDYKPRVFRGAF